MEEVKLALAAEILSWGRPLHVRALGTSMIPCLWPGDLLIIEDCDPHEVVVGDIIRFMQNGRFVIHRVVGMGRTGERLFWLTRGDSLQREDAPVLEDHFLGKVCAIRRNGKLISPVREVSPVAGRFGRLLGQVNHLHGVVLRIRALLRRSISVKPGLAKI